MKRNSLILSILTIVLCATLIAGSSFALFTSESKVNVAVTAGTVKVTATATTPTKTSTLGNNVAETTASLTDNAISLGKIVPGDVFTFDIIIHNESDVTVNYRTVLKLISGEKLWGGLKVTVEQKQTEDVPSVFALDTEEETDTVATPYDTMLPDCDDITLHVTVTLPVEAGNEYQGESCTFAYVVEAVQGNAPFDEAYVATIEQLNAAVESGVKKIILVADISITDRGTTAASAPYQVDGYGFYVNIDGKNVTLDLSGHNITLDGGSNAGLGGLINLQNGSLTIQGQGRVTVKGDRNVSVPVVWVQDNGTLNTWSGTYVNEMYCNENGICNDTLIYVRKSTGVANIYTGSRFIYPAQTDPEDGNLDNNTNCFNVKNGTQGRINIKAGVLLSCEEYCQHLDDNNITLERGCKVTGPYDFWGDGSRWYRIEKPVA